MHSTHFGCPEHGTMFTTGCGIWKPSGTRISEKSRAIRNTFHVEEKIYRLTTNPVHRENIITEMFTLYMVKQFQSIWVRATICTDERKRTPLESTLKSCHVWSIFIQIGSKLKINIISTLSANGVMKMKIIASTRHDQLRKILCFEIRIVNLKYILHALMANFGARFPNKICLYISKIQNCRHTVSQPHYTAVTWTTIKLTFLLQQHLLQL